MRRHSQFALFAIHTQLDHFLCQIISPVFSKPLHHNREPSVRRESPPAAESDSAPQPSSGWLPRATEGAQPCCARDKARSVYSRTICNRDCQSAYPTLRRSTCLCRDPATQVPLPLPARDLLLCGTTFKSVSGKNLFFLLSWPYFLLDARVPQSVSGHPRIDFRRPALDTARQRSRSVHALRSQPRCGVQAAHPVMAVDNHLIRLLEQFHIRGQSVEWHKFCALDRSDLMFPGLAHINHQKARALIQLLF